MFQVDPDQGAVYMVDIEGTALMFKSGTNEFVSVISAPVERFGED